MMRHWAAAIGVTGLITAIGIASGVKADADPVIVPQPPITTVVDAPPFTMTVDPPDVTLTVQPSAVTVEPPPPVTTTVTEPPVTTTVTQPPVTTTVTVTPTTTTAPPPPCGGPIVITTGGTYSGCYQSNDVNVPAVSVSTTQPVTLSKARIIAKGTGVSGWYDNSGSGARLTVRDSVFEQINPGGLFQHRAVRLFLPASFVFENNKLTDTDGVWLAGNDGHPVAMGQLIVNNNVAVNIGRYPHPTDTGCCVQFLQLSSVLTTGGQVWWNHVTNTPGKSSVEDNISFYQSGGTDSMHRIDVAYNLIDGAYPVTNESGFTGGGINLGDGAGGGHNTAHDNTVVSVTNYGIAVQGTDNYATNNVLINDGAEQKSDFGQAVVAWPSVTPSGLHATGTQYNWHRSTTDTAQYPCYVSSYCSGTQVSTTEQQARDGWEARRAGANVVVGPRP